MNFCPPSRLTSGSARTALLILVLVVLPCVLLLMFRHNREVANLERQLATLRAQLNNLDATPAQTKELEKLRAQVREAAEFKKEAAEVPRLRGEITQLRNDKALFEKASAENAQLRQQAQSAQRLQAENNALRGQVQSAVHNLQHVQALAVGQPGQAQKNACIANLKQIDGAIQQWALENRKTAISPVEWNGVLPYLKGSVLPLCPSGGAYGHQPGAAHVSASPICTVSGHTL